MRSIREDGQRALVCDIQFTLRAENNISYGRKPKNTHAPAPSDELKSNNDRYFDRYIMFKISTIFNIRPNRGSRNMYILSLLVYDIAFSVPLKRHNEQRKG